MVENEGEGSDERVFVSESQKICNLLKMTNSIKIELIPASIEHIEMKAYNWTLSLLD